MSKNKQFIFLFFNYIYLINNLLKHYFKISMKFPLNLPLEGDLGFVDPPSAQPSLVLASHLTSTIPHLNAVIADTIRNLLSFWTL